jgi:TolB protein
MAGGGHRAAQALLVALVALCATAPAAEGVTPGTNGRIAFSEICNGFAACNSIYSVKPDGTDLTRLTNTPGAVDDRPAWSPDGTRIAFDRQVQTPSGQPEAAIVVMDADGGNATTITPLDDFKADGAPTWSPDGQSIAFERRTAFVSCYEVDVVKPDGTGLTQIVPNASGPCAKHDLSWSPLGDKIAFDNAGGGSQNVNIWTMNPDGSAITPVAPVSSALGGPEWSPAGDRVVYENGGQIVTSALDGSNTHAFNPLSGGTEMSPTWSPDGSRFAFVASAVQSIDDAGGDYGIITYGAGWQRNLSWQPDPPGEPSQPGYPRPKGATPIDVSLVPAYTECTAPNKSHGTPLAFGSCAPPAQTSSSLTVGTPDANGAPANSIGRVRFDVVPGDPGTSADEADVVIGANLRDVRCRIAFADVCEAGAMSDYTGSLEAFATVRRTDKQSGGSGIDPATGTDWPQLSIPMHCTATLEASGGSCSGQTSLDTLLPGLVREGRRAIWELDQIAVRDGGIDDPRVDAFQTLAVQGVFVP